MYRHTFVYIFWVFVVLEVALVLGAAVSLQQRPVCSPEGYGVGNIDQETALLLTRGQLGDPSVLSQTPF